MANKSIPLNLTSLHSQEEKLRERALDLVESDESLLLHLSVVESVMNLADLLRQYKTSDDDMKVIQFLGMRMFNAFGAIVKLTLSGYIQNSALIMRDVLETVFLLDLFNFDRAAIERWRLADKQERMKTFAPVKVRNILDKRDRISNKKRAELYSMFSELAGHPNMNSILMMRPNRGGDAVIGPYIEATSLAATLSEVGRLAVQAGEQLDAFFPQEWPQSKGPRGAFARAKREWMENFYPRQSN